MRMKVQTYNEQRTNELLKKAREQRGWSQHKLAKQLDTTVRAIRRWESEGVYPQKYYREKLSTIFGVTEEELGLTPKNYRKIQRRDSVSTVEEMLQEASQSLQKEDLVPVVLPETGIENELVEAGGENE